MTKKQVPSFNPSVRYTNNLTIYFKNKLEVEVTDGTATIIVSRWLKPGGGTYVNSWRPFCRSLCQNNQLQDIWQIMSLATKYGLDICSKRGRASTIPQGVLRRPSIYKENRKNGRNI